ncbi:hypothetical protein C7A12_13080 [Pseudomonas fluorescens]|nr:hypothetical protein C7A12_13080 [Pseudomonas fluorescens]PRW78709.1 hypothetical protein C7A13_12690 [Pseudomonas fluorescens]
MLATTRSGTPPGYNGVPPLWRGSLLPLGREAAPKSPTAHPLKTCGEWVGAAAQPSGSNLWPQGNTAE